MTMKRLDQDPLRHDLLAWWDELQGWPGERARLRRCRTSAEAAQGPAPFGLVRRLAPHGFVPERVMAVALLGALVREPHVARPVAEQCAQPTKGNRPVLTDLRFRRLMRVDQQEDVIPVMRRVIHLLDGEANLPDLAQGVYWWNDSTKKDWAFRYYDKLPQEHLENP